MVLWNAPLGAFEYKPFEQSSDELANVIKKNATCSKRPPKDFSFDLYVYFLAKKNNLKIIRLPIKFPPRIYGKSNWNLNFFSRLNFIKRTLLYSLKLKKSL